MEAVVNFLKKEVEVEEEGVADFLRMEEVVAEAFPAMEEEVVFLKN